MNGDIMGCGRSGRMGEKMSAGGGVACGRKEGMERGRGGKKETYHGWSNGRREEVAASTAKGGSSGVVCGAHTVGIVDTLVGGVAIVICMVTLLELFLDGTVFRQCLDNRLQLLVEGRLHPGTRCTRGKNYKSEVLKERNDPRYCLATSPVKESKEIIQMFNQDVLSRHSMR